MIVLPLIIQVVYGASPTEAGFLMLPMVAGMMTATISSGRITSKTGKYRIFFNTGTRRVVLWIPVHAFDDGCLQPQFGSSSIGMVMIGARPSVS